MSKLACMICKKIKWSRAKTEPWICLRCTRRGR